MKTTTALVMKHEGKVTATPWKHDFYLQQHFSVLDWAPETYHSRQADGADADHLCGHQTHKLIYSHYGSQVTFLLLPGN